MGVKSAKGVLVSEFIPQFEIFQEEMSPSLSLPLCMYLVIKFSIAKK